jgi:hypothetical protein
MVLSMRFINGVNLCILFSITPCLILQRGMLLFFFDFLLEIFENKILWEKQPTNYLKKRKLAKAYSNHMIFSFFARRLSVELWISSHLEMSGFIMRHTTILFSITR